MKLAPGAHIHILGIAGHAMSGVAMAVRSLGYKVTGTDETAYPPVSDRLDAEGITWYREADPAHLQGVDLLVLGGGVAIDHEELLTAQTDHIVIQSYPEFVSTLIPTENRIVVTGTHGKTTTTSFIAWLLESAGRKPDFLVGIQPKNFDSSVRLAGGEVAVLEGDEYRSSRLDTSSKFSHYQAKTAIITSIEMDHPDLFKDIDAVRERFEGLVDNLPEDGLLVYCNDNEITRQVASKSKAQAVSYGTDDAHWRALNTQFNKDGITFDLQHDSEVVGSVSVPLYGQHNVANATAALAVGVSQGISIEDLQAGASSFLGASRRFERVSAPDDQITVIDDYAHHPTEVAATLAAARQHFTGNVYAVFQPHTYSRTQSLLKEYQACFGNADAAYIVDIEGAREANVSTEITSESLATESNVHYAADRSQLINKLKESLQSGDVLLCMSVNGYQNFAVEIHKLLNA